MCLFRWHSWCRWILDLTRLEVIYMCQKGIWHAIKYEEFKDMMQSDCLILPSGCDQKNSGRIISSRTRSARPSGADTSETILSTERVRSEREVDLEIKKTNSTSLPREADESQKWCQTEIDKRTRFQGQEQIVIGALTSKQIPFFNSELCRKGFGRIPFFSVFSVFCSVFSVFQFAVPFFPVFRLQFVFSVFSVFGSVCSQVRKIRSLAVLWRVGGRGIRVEGSGFLGLRVPGLKVQGRLGLSYNLNRTIGQNSFVLHYSPWISVSSDET